MACEQLCMRRVSCHNRRVHFVGYGAVLACEGAYLVKQGLQELWLFYVKQRSTGAIQQAAADFRHRTLKQLYRSNDFPILLHSQAVWLPAGARLQITPFPGLQKASVPTCGDEAVVAAFILRF